MKMSALKFSALCVLLVVHLAKAQENLTVTSDEFASHPFRKTVTEANIHTLLHGDLSVKKKLHVNEQTGKRDTLIVYKSVCCDFSFLKTKDQTVFYDASIVGDGIELSNGTKVGMTKENFFQVFKLSEEKRLINIYVITSSDATCSHSVYFEEDRISTIVIDGCTGQ